MKAGITTVSLVIMLVLSVGLIGCGGEEVPETTQYDLTVSSSEGGQVTSPGEGIHTHDGGTKVNLIAEADEGYQFASWTGDVSTVADVEDATTTVTMNGDYSITATFAVKQYSLVIHGTEGGSVTTPGEGAHNYDKGEVVNLVAVADEGYVFISWTGDISTIANVDAASTTITINSGYSITANFAGAIRDWYDLDAVRNNLDGSYILMNDLDCSTAGYAELASPTANSGEGWEPIGSLSVDPVYDYILEPVDAFTGSLDGQGYEIRDVSVNRPDEDGVGLVGSISGGVIENLGVVNVEVTGHVYVGGLVGENHYGSVSNAYSTGNVTGDQWVGGLMGGNQWSGYVSNSHSTGSVTGESTIGGLVGGNGGTVSDSYATGSVTAGGSVGGLVGSNWATVTNSHSSANVTGNGGVGGLVGWQHHGTVSNSYSTGSVTGGGSVGGLVGEKHDCAVSNSYYDYDKVLINGRNMITLGALPGEDFEQWLANNRFLDINQRLSQEDGYYLINDVSDLKQLLAFGQDDTLRFKLTNDLNLDNEPDFYIPYLAGEFDGNAHKISNLNFNSDFISQVGLFGYLASGGKVSGVSAENVNIFGQGYVGGLVGENEGTVSDSYATGRVAGYWPVGALVGSIGWNGGTLSNSYYNRDKVLINGEYVIAIGALFNEDFEQWLTNDRFLDVNERLSQEDGYYLINDVRDFKQLLAFGQDSSLKFRVKNDLDLDKEPNFYIPYLAGQFDGNGHKISNLRLNFDSVAQVGLFGYLAYGGKVSQVGVENIHVTVTDVQQVGGLVGENCGTVSKSYSAGSVTVTGSGGGLVGWNEGTVSGSYSSASVTGGDCGGLVAWNYGGTVRDSYSSGIVIGEWTAGGLVVSTTDGGTVSNSYSSGSVSGDRTVGGLVAYSHTIVDNSFWNTETSGQSASAGGTGKTTAQMKTVTTFSGAGWNIVGVANPDVRNSSYIWNIVDGETYPFLSWQSVS
jgi:hypothetical protein